MAISLTEADRVEVYRAISFITAALQHMQSVSYNQQLYLLQLALNHYTACEAASAITKWSMI